MNRYLAPVALVSYLLILAIGNAQADPQAPATAAAPGTAPRIVIHAGSVGKPISEYIYGQFVEHLGRCIYGGIWAEMLEDRKFFVPVGSSQSPWQPIGPSGRVTMDRHQPFVGEHTPKIALPGDGTTGGIVQHALGLRKGKRYVGRIWLAGSPQAGPVAVSLVWGDGPEQRQTVTVEKMAAEYAKATMQFTAGEDTDRGRLEIAAAGSGAFSVGTVSLMPADNVEGMRADTLELIKQLDSPVYRWPGGNFVSGYDWRDGVGDRDRRPPRKNLAWSKEKRTVVEPNDFGLDEFMVFCGLVNTEPFIAVNSGLGDVQCAVEEVQYANAPADMPGGRLRAKNGHAQPYGIKWWSIGNEMYGSWQLGQVPLKEYITRHNQFAAAMRVADPSIQLIAVGNVGAWTEGMLRQCADRMDLISEHFYCDEIPGDLVAHVHQNARSIARIVAAHRQYRGQIDSLKGKDIRIAMDEWNYWKPYHLKDALGIAAGLHEYFRQGDMIFMANYAQTVNVLGAITTNKTAATMGPTGLALMLYRRHFGAMPVAVEATEPLDVAAAWTADRRSLTIGIVNPTMQKLDISCKIADARLTGSGRRWQITGADPQARNAPGEEPAVKIEESSVHDVRDRLSVAVCSVTLLSLEAQ